MPRCVSNPFTFTAPARTLTVTYDDSATGTSVDKIFAGQDFHPQNPTNVGNVVKSTFGLTSSLSLSSNGNISGKEATITSSSAYDYLAIHFGQYEVFFHFAGLVTAGSEFKITGVSKTKGSKGGGLSNYRAYDSGVSEVPVPAAVFLFAPALLGFIGLRRKNKTTVA